MKLRILGLLGWLGFCYLLLLYIKLLLAGSFEKFYFHWDAPFWLFGNCLIGSLIIALVRHRFNLLNANSASVIKDFLLLVLLIPFVSILTTSWDILVIEKTIYGKTHTLFNWVSEYLIRTILLFFVGLSCISYFYIQTIKEIKNRLSKAQIAESEMQLKILQQKVNPHFLFNNLNVLSSLIEKNPKGANDFLDKLAGLYRYILHTQNTEVVSFEDELEFAQKYLYLLNKRFGLAYEFNLEILKSDFKGKMIVPTALQGLFENIVKHNSGSRKDTLQISVRLSGQYLIVENELRPKKQTEISSGVGLQNLQARYLLLTDKPFEFIKSKETFTVKVPLLEIT